ncbi:MAG: hypothetical protein ABWY30_07045 [Microterricola sp.]
MGIMDWLFGPRTPSESHRRAAIPRERSADEVAIERYRYLLRTAPAQTIEQAHAEAFAQLTPEQRAAVFAELSDGAPAGEQPRSDDARELAQAATRRELRSPGTLERSFSGQRGAGPGFGSMAGSSMLGTIAGVVIGSAIAQAFIPDSVGESTSADGGGSGADAGASDGGFGDTGFFGGADEGFGGGSFGGGSFGGGDF